MSIIIIVIVVLIVSVLVIYNSIISAKNNVLETVSSVDVFLKNRYDLIPNLVKIVQWYAKHEKEVFENVTKIRTDLMHMKWIDKNRIEKEWMLASAFKSIFAVAENYPELKASKNFLQLQEQLVEMEDRIQAARRTYNAAVKELKNKKEMFPTNLVAAMMRLEDYEMFEASVEATQNINVKI